MMRTLIVLSLLFCVISNVAANVCDSSPCLSGETCANTTLTEYECTDINDCASNPCTNGACVDEGNNDFSCDCSGTDYTGSLCDTDMYPTVGLARIYGTNVAPDVTGTVEIKMLNDSYSRITYDIQGLYPGYHSLHIHGYGDVSGGDAMRTGGHYNPYGTDHGCYPSASRHVGDLFNITADDDGNSYGVHVRDLIHIKGDISGLGRAIVIHELFDDCGDINGNAGARHAQGVIGYANSAGSEAYAPNPASILSGQGYGTEGNEDVMFNVYFNWKNVDVNVVTMYANFSGLTPDGIYAFHIHEFGDLTLNDGTSCGGHYNPTGSDHGLVYDDWSVAHHQGDLGNVFADEMGMAYMLKNFSLLTNDETFPSSWEEAFNALTGRGLVLHAGEDDGTGATGNAGSRLAAGVIGVANPEYFPEELFLCEGCQPDPLPLPDDDTVIQAAGQVSPFAGILTVIMMMAGALVF